MPKGSVRSIAALATLGGALYMWVTGQDMTQAQELFTTAMLGGYFVQRTFDSGTSKPDGSQQVNLMGD